MTSSLTNEQRKVVLDTEHHMMVEAGAGSGKTTLLIEKIAFELGHGSIPGERPRRVLTIDDVAAITFTRKAAGEIKERLRQEFLRKAEAAEGAERERWAERAFRIDEALIGTIDSFAGRIIRDYGALAGVEAGYEVLDPGDATALRLEAVEEALLAGIEHDVPGAVFLVRQFGFLRARTILNAFIEQAALLVELEGRLASRRLRWADVAKRLNLELNTADYLLEHHAQKILSFACETQRRYRRRLERDGVLDHAHVVLKATEIAALPAVQAAFQKRIKLVFVDEHQDTDASQVRLLFRLTGISAAVQNNNRSRPTTRLVLIGDPKQGIYGFRHADITMWRASRHAIERVGGRYYTLTQNHRSRPALVRFIDDAFSRIMGEEVGTNDYEVPFQSLSPTRPESEEPAVELLLTSERGVAATAAVVAERIREMLSNPEDYPVYERGDDGREYARPVRARDIAILSRNLKGVADHYEQALRARGIDSYVYGGRGLYNRQEVQDLAMLLRAVVDPYDPFVLSAFLRSPLGGVDDRTLIELASACTETGNEAQLALFDALQQADRIVADPDRARAAVEAASLLNELRAVRDRLPHHQLLEIAIERTGYRTFLAGAPDAPAGIRNVEKLLRIARRSAREPLSEFVRRLGARVDRADPEDEAPLYAPDDDLVAISTIHKAKGLEWPYVFVVGIDDRLFRPLTTDSPHLVRDLGVVLPLDVIVRDGDGDSMSLEEKAATWGWYEEEAKRRDYAEAKRLFYVATTRARDRLILVGALTDTKRERRLTRPIRSLHTQTVEHWLRYLYPEIVRPDVEYFRYGQGDRGEIRRAATELIKATPTNGEVPGLMVRAWPTAARLVGDLPDANARWGLGIDERIGPVRDRAAIRDEFSASEILKYAICPWQHFYGYAHNISSPTIEIASGDAVVNQILPEKRGDILHDYLREHQDGWSPTEMHLELKRVLLRHLPMAEDEADKNTRELMQHVNHYLASEWYTRVRNARQVLREIPVVVQMNGYRLRVKLDLLFEEEDGWRILDFKTALFRGLEHKIHDVVAERTRDYEIQAAIYSLAAREAGCDLREFVFYFTAPALATRIQPTEEWLRTQIARIEFIVRQIQKMDYDDDPIWSKPRCQGCEYLPICQPVGMPEDVLVTIGS